MSSLNLPARRSSRLSHRALDRATGTALADLHTGAFLERAEDETQRSLTIARMSDIGVATHHALSEGDEIVRDLAGRLDANPLGANALGGIAEDGIRGVRHQLRRLTESR